MFTAKVDSLTYTVKCAIAIHLHYACIWKGMQPRRLRRLMQCDQDGTEVST